MVLNSLQAGTAQFQDENTEDFFQPFGGHRSCGNVVFHSLEKDLHCCCEEDAYSYLVGNNTL